MVKCKALITPRKDDDAEIGAAERGNEEAAAVYSRAWRTAVEAAWTNHDTSSVTSEDSESSSMCLSEGENVDELSNTADLRDIMELAGEEVACAIFSMLMCY